MAYVCSAACSFEQLTVLSLLLLSPLLVSSLLLFSSSSLYDQFDIYSLVVLVTVIQAAVYKSRE